MTTIYVDATTLIALGAIGELDLLTSFDGDLIVLPAIQAEATTEPARTNLERFLEHDDIGTERPAIASDKDRAKEVLGESEVNGDVRVIAAVLSHTAAEESMAVVSDDRRVRTVARGLGADVTGTIGVIVRAVHEGLPAEEAKTLVRRVVSNHTAGSNPTGANSGSPAAERPWSRKFVGPSRPPKGSSISGRQSSGSPSLLINLDFAISKTLG